MAVGDIGEDNKKLIERFGATGIDSLKEVPDFYTFNNRLMVSHRDFGTYYERIKKGEKSAIVSGLNPS
jgi:hypothetical protein